MIELPGSFSGSRSSPRPLRGPEPSQRRSSAILVKDTAKVFSALTNSNLLNLLPNTFN